MIYAFQILEDIDQRTLVLKQLGNSCVILHLLFVIILFATSNKTSGLSVSVVRREREGGREGGRGREGEIEGGREGEGTPNICCFFLSSKGCTMGSKFAEVIKEKSCWRNDN